jgi:hypothetical protein
MAMRERTAKFKQRLQTLRVAFARTREVDRKLVPLMAAFGVGALLLFGASTAVLIHPVPGVLFGLLFG